MDFLVNLSFPDDRSRLSEIVYNDQIMQKKNQLSLSWFCTYELFLFHVRRFQFSAISYRVDIICGRLLKEWQLVLKSYIHVFATMQITWLQIPILDKTNPFCNSITVDSFIRQQGTKTSG